MFKYSLNFLKGISLITIFFFLITSISFIFIYSGIDINKDVKKDLSNSRFNINNHHNQLLLKKNIHKDLKNSYHKFSLEYNILKEQIQVQALNVNSTTNKISNTKIEISKKERKILKLNSDIEKLKTNLGQ